MSKTGGGPGHRGGAPGLRLPGPRHRGPGGQPADHRPQPDPALQAAPQGNRPDRRLRRRPPAAPHGGIPAQLQEMTVEVNRHGLLQSKGLPVCQLSRDPARLDRTGPAELRRRADRLGPVLGPHRPARPGRLPDPRAGFDLQRPQKGTAGPLRPHLHRQPLLHLLRHPLRDPARSPRAPTAPSSPPPCPRRWATGATSTGSSSP